MLRGHRGALALPRLLFLVRQGRPAADVMVNKGDRREPVKILAVAAVLARRAAREAAAREQAHALDEHDDHARDAERCRWASRG